MTIVTAPPRVRTEAGEELRLERRAGRYDAQRFLWRESRLCRVAACGKTAVSPGGDVALQLTVDGNGRRGGFAGVATCGSPWACPVCSHKIAVTRAADIQAAVEAWHAGGNRIAFVTLTQRHHAGQGLAMLWDALSDAWTKTTNGKAWNRDQSDYGVPMSRVVKTGKKAGQVVTNNRIGCVRVVETTHGEKGWHVHIHALLFVRDGMTDDDVAALADSMFGRWLPALTDAGLSAPSFENGIDIKMVRRWDSKALGDYFSKTSYVGRVAAGGAGWEMAGGAGKTARRANRTPFQILADVVALGLESDLALWHEWEAASKGRRQLTWSGGLRAFLALGVEVSDDDAATEKPDSGKVVRRFTAEEWRAVRWHRAALLNAVENLDPDVLNVLVADLLQGVYSGIHDDR